MRILIVLLIFGILPACDRVDLPGARADRDRSDPDRQPTVYARSMVYLAGQETAPVAAILDFATIDAPASTRRSAGAWFAAGGDRWDPLLDLSWTADPVREPWRLLPHGPLRVLVDDAGEIEALVGRAEGRAFRLLPAAALGEWSPDGTAQFRVRRAELRVGEERHLGVLLDLQSGALMPGSTAPAEVFLTDGEELLLVVPLASDSTTSAWLRIGERAETWETVSIEATGDAAGAGPADGAGSGWRIEEPTGGVTGEVLPIGTELSITPLDGAAIGSATASAVRGWVEVHGQRRSVFGIVKRSRGS